MKLIIDIPNSLYANLAKIRNGSIANKRILDSVKNGTPLDDVKADMEKAKRFHVGTFEDDNPIDYGIVEGFDKAIEILDDIGRK